MNMDIDKISVVICTYNGSKYIQQQLNSIIKQSRTVDEIIVGDDASTDNTLEIVRNLLAKSKIPYFILEHKENVGVTKNFIECMKKCSGDIIITSDQDDIWYDNKVSTIINSMEKSESVLVFSDADLVDGTGARLGVSLWETLSVDKNEIEKNYFDKILKGNIVTGATMAFRTFMIHQIEDVPDGHLHDEWIALNAIRFGNITPIESPLIAYRQHDNNVVGAKKESLIKKIKNYLSSFEDVHENRNKKYKFYHTFYESAKEELTQENYFKIKECTLFWADARKLDEIGRIKGINIILKNLKNGRYSKYYNGFRGAVKDLITCIVSRRHLQEDKR